MFSRSFFVNEIKVLIKEGHDYITLNVLLKLEDIIATGGEAKFFLRENEVKVNGELENRRGRKLYPGDLIEVNGNSYRIFK